MSLPSIPESFIRKFWWYRGHLAAQNSDFSHRRNGEEIDIFRNTPLIPPEVGERVELCCRLKIVQSPNIIWLIKFTILLFFQFYPKMSNKID